MTNQPNPEIDGTLLPAAGRWRSDSGHAWLVLRSGHGLASDVSSVGPALSGAVYICRKSERAVMHLDVDLRCLIIGCESCHATQPAVDSTLTLESTRVGPVTTSGWALAGTLTSRAATTAVASELEVRGVHQRFGEAPRARFTVRTRVPVAALGLCDTHRVGNPDPAAHAELLTHMLATHDATS